MNTRITQEQLIKRVLLTEGAISRNWCLSQYISRLGSRIFDLKKQGLNIEAKIVKNGNSKDYVYYLRREPEQLKIIN